MMICRPDTQILSFFIFRITSAYDIRQHLTISCSFSCTALYYKDKDYFMDVPATIAADPPSHVKTWRFRYQAVC